jgi:hypothetical protein
MPRRMVRSWEGWIGVGYLDGMNGANGDPRDGHAGKDVTADLEGAHRQSRAEDGAGGWAEL